MNQNERELVTNDFDDMDDTEDVPDDLDEVLRARWNKPHVVECATCKAVIGG